MQGRRSALLLIVSVLCGFSAHGQISPPQPQNIDPTSVFEVATIKPFAPDQGLSNAGPRWFRFIDASHWTAHNQTLKECIAYAYNLPPELISGGPGWIDSDRYEIVALEPGETRPSNEQNRVRFQNLLGDRFRLRFHRERKQMTVYNLTVGNSLPKMAESTLEPEKFNLVVGPSPKGGPMIPARATTMAAFASALQGIVYRPVIDKTGLTKRYDFDLEFSPEGTRIAPPGYIDTGHRSPDIFTAVQQIGLRLEPSQGQVEVIVIDHVEQPSEN
jgi:uncharacterized protein (TIGR03435 family)